MTWGNQQLKSPNSPTIAETPAVTPAPEKAEEASEVEQTKNEAALFKAQADKIREETRKKQLEGEFCELSAIAKRTADLDERERIVATKEAQNEKLRNDNLDLAEDNRSLRAAVPALEKREKAVLAAEEKVEADKAEVKREKAGLQGEVRRELVKVANALRYLEYWAMEKGWRQGLESYLAQAPAETQEVFAEVTESQPKLATDQKNYRPVIIQKQERRSFDDAVM